jgi:hypothetical protein
VPPSGYAPTLLEAAPLAPRPSLFSRQIAIGQRNVSVWLFGALALGSVFFIALVIVVGSLVFGGKSAAATVQAAVALVDPDSELAKLTARAEQGDQTALAELTARPEAKRKKEEWRALGHGYAKLNQFGASVGAYQHGVQAHPVLASDKVLLKDVRLAANEALTTEPALKLAASSLGAPGVDLLYDVWESNKGVPSKAALAKQARALLDDDAVRAKAPPATKLLLELGKAQKEGCPSVKRWLARAATEGDARVVPLLKRFEDRRGCGFLGLGDCYGCLRAGKDLGNTADSAAARPAPSFD